MNILVTGGTGFLGARVARRLLTDGHRVTLLGRNFSNVQPLLASGAIPLQIDLANASAVSAAFAGMDAVCHAGALSAPWGKRADFFSANVNGTRAVVEGCRAHGVQRLVYISSPSVVFSGRDVIQADESAPYPPRFTSTYALTKKLGEDLVNAAPDVPAVILRPKAIFGPGDGSLLPRLIAAARQGRLPQIGSGRNQVDLTYVDNVVSAILLAFDSPAAVGRTYTITNGESVPLWQVIRQVLERLGLSTRLRTVSLPLALAAARLMEWRAALTGSEPLLTRYSVLILARNQTYDISAARRDLGYQPGVSIAAGIEHTLAAL